MPVAGVGDTEGDGPEVWAVSAAAELSVDTIERQSVAKALELLIDGEVQLLAAYDARQGSADSRITALATAAIALPTLTLSLSKAFAQNPAPLRLTYVAVVVAAALVVFARAWNGWRRRSVNVTDARLNAMRTKPRWTISAEAIDVTKARNEWRAYQRETPVHTADPIRVQQLALGLSRARARDSHKVAQIKDGLSVAAAAVFVAALVISADLVAHAHFS